ncbi:hypothetical protein Cgig2_006805 [Carnegiea gigantea]|uniref:PB1-like domain-containing protein n=1 Tax=Carnegiea gigantea TaxID=171969 RepID=A0A9Q1GZ30_9CARY|nr:hypothetical protein Cgig2_006805 [Carnegiea gigantea]
MGDDSIILHLHHGGKFVKERKLKYEGGSYRIIEPVDVDRLSYFELKGIAYEKVGYVGLLDFFYVISGCSMESDLRRLFTDEESIEMLKHFGEFRKQNSNILETKSIVAENETIIDEALGGGTELQSEYEDNEVEWKFLDKPSSSASPTKRGRGRPRKEIVDPLQEFEPTAAP